MQRVSVKRHGSGRSKLDTNLSLPDDPLSSISLLGPPSNGPGDGAPPPTPPNPPQPAPTSTAANSMGSGGDPGGSTPTLTASPTSGRGTTASPESIVPSATSPMSVPRNPTSSSGINNASSSSSTASSSGPGGVGNSLGVGGQSAVVNAQPASSTATSAAPGTSTPAALAAASPSSSQYLLGSGSNTAGADSSSPTVTASTAVSSGKHLSAGAIAGITIACLFFLPLLVLVLVRRRLIAGRMKLRRQWWFGHQVSRENFSFANNGGFRSSAASSARSSFVTNFDQGLILRADSTSRRSLGGVPDLPPTAEVRERNSVLISTGGAIARKESMNSMLSNGSDPDAQHPTVSGQDNLEPSWPISVRPFSPSESFAFPKPPAPPPSTVDPFPFLGTQGPSSAQSPATLAHLSIPSRAFMTDLPPVSVSTSSLYPQASMSSVSLPPFFAAPNPSLDPFADPEKPGFADTEVICHAFNPSLEDELAVRPGDRVRLLRVFDDGWVSIEKLASADEEHHERGLIPVACLPETSQLLPTFPTQKRDSNYESDQLVATAL